MKIEIFKINMAVADGVDREELEKLVCLMLGQGIKNVFGVEIEGDGPRENSKRITPEEPAEETPRKKRKYTRRAKPADGDDKRTTTRGRGEPAGAVVKDGVVRVKRDDGTTIERRGNCQGGGTV